MINIRKSVEAPEGFIYHTDDPPYCATCKLVLFRANGTRWVHNHSAVDDHPVVFVPRRSLLPDAIIKCDYCSRPDSVWTYRFAETRHDVMYETKAEVYGVGDYRDRHHAARVLRRERGNRITTDWGEWWSACEGCAELIEARDLPGIVTRITESLPARLRRGNRLITSRADIRRTHEPMFAGESYRQRIPGR